MIPTILPLAAALSLVLSNVPKQDSAEATTVRVENQRVKALFESMRKGNYDTNRFPQLDLSDVPALLEHADSTRRLTCFPVNPLSSQRQDECSEGMVALWLIEGVRQDTKFPSLNPLCLKKDVRGKDWNQASENNHETTAQAYRAWWSKAKKLSPPEAKALQPLQGTELHWH